MAAEQILTERYAAEKSSALESYLLDCVRNGRFWSSFLIREDNMKRLQAAELIVFLYELMAKGKNLQNIVDEASLGIGNPIFIADSNLNIIAHSAEKEPLCDTQWNNSLSATDNYMLLLELRNRGIESVSLKEPNTVMIFDYDFLERRWMYGSVHIDGVFIAQVCSVEYYQEFSEHDKKVVECLCVITKFFIEHNHIFHSSDHIKMEYLMNRVLANEKVPVEQLKEQMPYINWNGSISHYVAVIAPSATADTYNMAPHKRWLIDAIHNSRGIVFDNQIVLLISQTSLQTNSGFLPPASVEKYLVASRCKMCVSHGFANLEDIVDHYAQAKNTLELSQVLSPKQRIGYFGDYYVSNIFKNVLKNSSGYDYMHIRLLEIMQYDKTYSTDYLNDLHVYLVAGCSSTKAARMLGIHRNTVNYRIEKICDLFSINLKDPETVFNLGLSLRIFCFYKKLNQPGK